MSDTTATLLDDIASLTDAHTIEAAQLLATAMGANDARELLDPGVERNPMEHYADVVDLGRILLTTAALTPPTRPLVEESIAGVGRRSLVLTPDEIVFITGLVLGALQMRVEREKTEDVEIKERPDGTSVTSIRRRASYKISNRAAAMLRRANRSHREPPDDDDDETGTD